MQIKLAEALLRRKELAQKVERAKHIKDNHLYYEIRGERKRVTEGLDDINANFPKLQLNQVTEEFDFYARQLRLIDAAIQQGNWTFELNVDDVVMKDFESNKK